MDISAEIAAIQAASQGSELRQPLVGALNKLNSGSLPAVTSSDAGKILKVGANGWEVGEKSGYMPVPTATKQITENGTHDVTDYASAVVNVSGGASSVLISKTITQNGTYDPTDDNADGYSEVTVNVSGGSSTIEEWDFTGSNPIIGKIHGISCSNTNVTFNANGANYSRTDATLSFVRPFFDGCTIEIDVGSMSLSTGNHRRFVMATPESGFIYRNNGKWSLYGTTNSWSTDSNISDGGFFANSTVKIIVDSNSYWHIYKNNVLVYEPDVKCSLNIINKEFTLGASSYGINNVVVTGLRVYI